MKLSAIQIISVENEKAENVMMSCHRLESNLLDFLWKTFKKKKNPTKCDIIRSVLVKVNFLICTFVSTVPFKFEHRTVIFIRYVYKHVLEYVIIKHKDACIECSRTKYIKWLFILNVNLELKFCFTFVAKTNKLHEMIKLMEFGF